MALPGVARVEQPYIPVNVMITAFENITNLWGRLATVSTATATSTAADLNIAAPLGKSDQTKAYFTMIRTLLLTFCLSGSTHFRNT